MGGKLPLRETRTPLSGAPLKGVLVSLSGSFPPKTTRVCSRRPGFVDDSLDSSPSTCPATAFVKECALAQLADTKHLRPPGLLSYQTQLPWLPRSRNPSIADRARPC